MLRDLLDEGQNLDRTLAALEQSSIVVVLDRHGSCMYTNQIFNQLAGSDREQMVGRSLPSFTTSGQAEDWFADVRHTLQQGRIWKGELCCTAGETMPFWLHATIIPYFNEQGEMYRSMVFGTDITERKRQEVKMKQTIDNLFEIENALDESSIVAITDRAGVITYVNDKFCEISKYSREDLLGKTHRIINSGFHPKSFFKQMWDTIGEGNIWRGEVKNRAKDGTEYWMNTTIVPFLDDNKKPRQYISIRSDITSRVKAEKELAERTEQLAKMHDEAVNANKVKSQFLANMSHELRTPLNAIIGYSEMLREEAEELGNPVLAKDLQKISKAGSHLLALINDILDISKIEAGKMELHYESCSLPELMQDVVATMRPLIEEKGNRLVHECMDQGQMLSDVLKIRQIILNLLSNANKFTDRGVITFRIAAEQRDGQDGCSIIVQDTGIGMTGEQMAKLFQPFTQADSSTTRKYGGTGLGLSISHRFIQMLGGALQVNSEPGVGTVFTCWLPRLQAEPRKFIPSDAIAESTNRSGSVNIVIIDDEVSDCVLMERYLAKTGWTTAYARDPEEGLQLAKICKPNVICLDILMPDRDGWSVLTALKEDPETAHIPIVVWSMATDRQRGHELGVAEFLAKPSERERLIEVMGKYIGK